MATVNSTAGSGPLLDGAARRRLPNANLAHGDAETIELRGTVASFAARGLVLPGGATAPIAHDANLTVPGPDGHTWMVWGSDPFAMHAQRKRTDTEREAWIDHQNARHASSFFSIDRAHTMTHVADHLAAMADTMPRGPRGKRARDSLSMVAFVLRDLATNPSAHMASVREMLSLVDINVPQLEVH